MAASGKQPFEVTDFSGGITDNVFGGEMNSGEVMDNFFITPEKKLYSRPGSVVDNVANALIPLGNSRVGALINYARNDKLFVQSARQIFYRGTDGSYLTLTGPSGADALNVGTTANFITHSEWNKQAFVVNDAFAHPVRIFKDGSNNYQLRSVGLPMFASAPLITPNVTGGASYVYAFIYTYQYTVQTQTFKDLGPAKWVTITNSSDPSSSANVISNIPALTNANGYNYDLANVQVEIFRTINNGTNFYRVGTVSNGVTTFTDGLSDTAIQTNLQLYTNDGTLDYYPAPAAKCVHIVKNTGFYGYTKDDTGEHPYRVAQSVPGNPGFVPLITWVEVEDEVKGLNSVKDLPILLCKKMIYRLDGVYQASGQGGMTPVKIHHTAGCISANSCVEAENFLFWAGTDGFYSTDGYQVTKISDHLNQRYQTMLSATSDPGRIQGKYDEQNRRVIWSVEMKGSSLDNDSLFVLDLRWGVSPRSSFTTCSGNSFRPTAIEVFNGNLYRGDSRGFVFRHDPTLLSDPKVDTTALASTWAKETVIWTVKSNQFNFGGSFMRKMVSRILLQAENAGNTTIQITASNDQGKKVRDLKPIRWRRNFTWGDESFVWGNLDCVWAGEGLIEQWRRFPAGGLRLSYLQLTITNAFGIVAASESAGKCVINPVAKTAILPSGWPSASVDYVLTTSADNYQRQFPVVAVNGSLDTVTLSDPSSQLPVAGQYDWELFGKVKGEPLNLLGYNLHWDSVDQNQITYRPGDSGAND